MSKVTARVYEPSLPICEDMYSMFSTPLTCCSIGAATVSATTWALAPGNWQATWMVGGVISGYWAIGRLTADISPTRTMTIEMTQAKTGRSMKKRASTSSPFDRQGDKETRRERPLGLRFARRGQHSFCLGLLVSLS